LKRHDFEIEKSDSRFSSIPSFLDEEKIALKFILSQIDMNNGMREEKSEKSDRAVYFEAGTKGSGIWGIESY